MFRRDCILGPASPPQSRRWPLTVHRYIKRMAVGKMAKALQQSMVGLIASNLRELRKRGLTPADLLALEKLAVLARNGSGIVRVSDLGRLLGIGRAGAHYRIGQLVAKSVAVRVGRCVILNVKGLLAMAADAVKARLARAKELFSWERMPKRSKPLTDTRQEDKKEAKNAPISDWRVGDVASDGRMIVGDRLLGLIRVPVWG